jgi:hypothetical protein
VTYDTRYHLVDILGVLPGALQEDIRGHGRREWSDLVSGAGRAPFSLLAAADRAQQAADNAWRALADPPPGK